MIELEEAQEFVFGKCSKLSAEEGEISKSRGLVLAETVISNDDIPPFPNTAIDGYAVRASDTESEPVEFFNVTVRKSVHQTVSAQTLYATWLAWPKRHVDPMIGGGGWR